MEEEAKANDTPCAAILPRLDRVDRLVQLVEERHECSCGKRRLSRESDTVSAKTLSSAVEEAHCKGTLIDRLELLEKRVLQLWIENEHEGVTKTTVSSAAESIEPSKSKARRPKRLSFNFKKCFHIPTGCSY